MNQKRNWRSGKGTLLQYFYYDDDYYYSLQQKQWCGRCCLAEGDGARRCGPPLMLLMLMVWLRGARRWRIAPMPVAPIPLSPHSFSQLHPCPPCPNPNLQIIPLAPPPSQCCSTTSTDEIAMIGVNRWRERCANGQVSGMQCD